MQPGHRSTCDYGATGRSLRTVYQTDTITRPAYEDYEHLWLTWVATDCRQNCVGNLRLSGTARQAGTAWPSSAGGPLKRLHLAMGGPGSGSLRSGPTSNPLATLATVGLLPNNSSFMLGQGQKCASACRTVCRASARWALRFARSCRSNRSTQRFEVLPPSKSE